jgi:hypothetical protein
MEMFWIILLSTLGLIIAGYCVGIFAWYTNSRIKPTGEDARDVSPRKRHRIHKAA